MMISETREKILMKQTTVYFFIACLLVSEATLVLVIWSCALNGDFEL